MRTKRMLAVLLATAGLVAGTATPALALADEEVIVFTADYLPVTVYKNPTGCNLLPLLGAHVLINQTGRPVTIHPDPLCLIPGPSLQSGQGAHVSPLLGSFKAG